MGQRGKRADGPVTPRPCTKRRYRYRSRIAPRSASPRVAYQGMGSGPGSASRASPPTIKPQMTRPTMKISIAASPRPLAELRADEQDPLEHGQPGGRGQQRDRPHKEPDADRREHEAACDHHHALGARPQPDVAAEAERLRLRARIADEERAGDRR